MHDKAMSSKLVTGLKKQVARLKETLETKYSLVNVLIAFDKKAHKEADKLKKELVEMELKMKSEVAKAKVSVLEQYKNDALKARALKLNEDVSQLNAKKKDLELQN
jgi:hypothetical protein